MLQWSASRRQSRVKSPKIRRKLDLLPQLRCKNQKLRWVYWNSILMWHLLNKVMSLKYKRSKISTMTISSVISLKQGVWQITKKQIKTIWSVSIRYSTNKSNLKLLPTHTPHRTTISNYKTIISTIHTTPWLHNTILSTTLNSIPNSNTPNTINTPKSLPTTTHTTIHLWAILVKWELETIGNDFKLFHKYY